MGKNFHRFSGFEVQRVRCHNKSEYHRKMKVSKFAEILQLSEKEFLSFPKKYRKINGNGKSDQPFSANMSATHCMQQDAAVRLHFIFHSNPMEESRLLSAIGDARYSLRDRRKKGRGTWEKVLREKGSKI